MSIPSFGEFRALVIGPRLAPRAQTAIRMIVRLTHDLGLACALIPVRATRSAVVNVGETLQAACLPVNPCLA